MEAKDVLEHAFQRQVYLYVEDGKLKFKAKSGGVDSVLKEQLVTHKKEIVDLLSSSKAWGSSRDHSKINVVRRGKDVAQLSYAQQRLWVIDRMGGGSPEYNIPIAISVEGEFDTVAAEQSIAQIVERHESLRTVFEERSEGLVQVVRETADFSLKVYELDRLSSADRETKLAQLIQEDRDRVFDLSQDLMIRAGYVKLSSDSDTSRGILLFNMHHIASDGWSMGLLMDEFISRYKTISQGDLSKLPPLAIQYSDYAHSQREWLAQGELDRQLSYWKVQLEEVPEVHAVPLDYSRPKNKEHVGGVVVGSIDAETLRGLQKVASHNGMTLFMLLHASLSLLLSRHSNSQDIVLGSPVANRGQKELEPLIGLFVNTLVLRTSTEFKKLSDYLQHVRKVNLDAQAHQDIPFEQLIDHCKITRSLAYSPLFQIMFSTDTAQSSELDIPGLRFQSIEDTEPVAKFDLDISAAIDEHGIQLSWIYDCSLFTHAHIEQMNSHLEQLIKSIAGSKSDDIADISMLSTHESQRLIDTMNATDDLKESDQLIHELFEVKARRHPNNIAVVCENHRLTYKGLNQSANKLAHYLRSQGCVSASMIGIYIDRSAQMMIAILAVLKAGGTYVPLDPSYPRARLELMLANADIKYLLSTSELMDKFEVQSDITVIELDNEAQNVQAGTCEVENPSRLEGQNQTGLAYIVYTSGSTGQPKGVIVTHHALVQHIVAIIDALDFRSDDRVLQLASFSFDTFIEQTFAALSVGATLVVTPASLIDVSRFFEMVDKYDVTVTDISSGFFTQLVSENYASFWENSSINRMVIGGEAVSIKSVRDWYANGNANKTRLYNAYGPTEAVITSTIRLIDQEDKSKVRIGRAIGNRKLYVLDRHLCLCPYGAVGELYIGGDCLAMGYLNHNDITEKSFVQNPFIGDLKGKMYRTGDLVRYLDDGNLEFIGRADEQIKLRGYRIELAEIEQHLAEQTNIVDSKVIVREDVPEQKRLVCYLIIRPTEELSDRDVSDQIKKSLQNHLPSYMVPSVFVAIKKWPLTVNGKIDIKALPIPGLEDIQGTFISPSNAIERTLVDILAGLLKVDVATISVAANFFELGGHSLLAIRYVAEINQCFAIKLDVQSIFVHPKIEDLAARITSGKRSDVAAVTSNMSELLPFDPTLETMYCIPGAGAISLSFKELVLAAQGEINIRCFDHKGLMDIGQPHSSIEEIVEDYLSVILAHQAQGPYLILGHSFGGVIGFELAARLNSMGHKVSLVLIDSFLFPSGKSNAVESENGIYELFNVEDEEVMTNIKERFFKQELPTENGHGKDQLRLKKSDEDYEMSKFIANVKKIYSEQARMMMSYQPISQLKQGILFLYASDSSELMSDQFKRVEELSVEGIQLAQLEGSHYSILTQDVPALWRHIQGFLSSNISVSGNE